MSQCLKVVTFALISSVTLYILHTLKKYNTWDILYEIDDIDDVGVLSVVKDIRGEEPYMTIKMTCYFNDNRQHGDKWQTLIDDDDCHSRIFDNCYRNRSVIGRRETHVLRFINENNIRRCSCTDIRGWCHAECSHFQEMKCCLDRGKNSVLCRK